MDRHVSPERRRTWSCSSSAPCVWLAALADTGAPLSDVLRRAVRPWPWPCPCSRSSPPSAPPLPVPASTWCARDRRHVTCQGRLTRTRQGCIMRSPLCSGRVRLQAERKGLGTAFAGVAPSSPARGDALNARPPAAAAASSSSAAAARPAATRRDLSRITLRTSSTPAEPRRAAAAAGERCAACGGGVGGCGPWWNCSSDACAPRARGEEVGTGERSGFAPEPAGESASTRGGVVPTPESPRAPGMGTAAAAAAAASELAAASMLLRTTPSSSPAGVGPRAKHT
jgi:hypothetical protein